MSNLNQLTIYEASQLIKAGKVTPIELVKDCLDRIKEVDQELLAWRVVDELSSMETARSLTQEMKNGKVRGPLHGIPVGIKDIFDVAGLPTRAGSVIFENVDPAVEDCSIVAKLREAGAVIIGKTHVTQLAFYEPSPTRNPYHLQHTPGGSSSGSAAAISANMALLTLGAQTNASISRPGAYCGAVCFKPTTHSIQMDGVFPLAPSFDSPGLFANSLLDLAIGYQPFSDRSVNDLDELYLQSLTGGSCKVGVVSDAIYSEASIDLQNVQEETIKRLEVNHYEIKEVQAPRSFSDLIDLHRLVMAYEAAQHHHALVEEHDIGGKFGALVEEGQQISEGAYKDAMDNIHRVKSEMLELFDSFDVLLTLPTDTSAPEGLDPTGNPKFTTPWAALGVPLVVIPAALDGKGLPLAMMFASAPGSDFDLIKNCLPIERVMGKLPLPMIGNCK
ncbi:amidase [Peribacillus cavernae]|uniref:amidase n=1 Tax=Peribacillus cavernae TaxID=1674310 RepID=UPI00163BB01F|nr:amidase [Peribacillus cavernae]MDQ0221396.1 Asp-tRNA(Asn)/Glu-tRNA(Gln) amidotransferase A subunit family amidase [Peribacillus cavernae]